MRKLLLLMVVAIFASVTQPARAQFCPGVSPWVFDDVPASDPFCGYITWMAQNGISLGCQVIDANHRLYCPSGTVTRAAMAAFMNRLGNVRVEAVGTGPGLTGGPITGIGTINLATTQLLPTTACANGQIARWNGSAWACSTDANSGGTVTSVGSGTGLSGGPITASGTLSIAAGYQLPQGCTNGQVAKSNGAGGWTCASDATGGGGGTVTSVTAGAGLTGGTITTSGTIAVDPTSATLAGNFLRQNGNAFGATAVLGTIDNNAIDILANNSRVVRYEPNAVSPNVIGGSPANSVTAGVRGATIGGGAASASAIDPDYGAGVPNRVTDVYGTVGGGFGNVAGNATGSISDAAGATVAGGVANQATGKYAAVGGGNGNKSGGYASAVPGGNNNLASGDWAGIGGGFGGTASGIASVIAGGESGIAGGDYSSVSGGRSALAFGNFSTVSGGDANTASNIGAVIGGGVSNTALGQYSTVAGGFTNIAGGNYSTVVGGGNNQAPGFGATVLGGAQNTATSDFAVASGYSANADQIGGFMFANWSAGSASCLGLSRVARFALDHGLSVDYFTRRADGGGTRWVYIGDALANSKTISAWNGAGLTDAGVWANASDRALKEGFAPIDPQSVLEGVIALPVTRWRYRTEALAVSHIGPTAQDFKAAFGLGVDDKSIGTVDSEGVALAAIQGLNAKLEAKVAEQAREIVAARASIAEQAREIADLKSAHAAEMAELKRAVEVLMARTSPEGRVAAR
ncbi:MAG: tail fiber domain-containing protein [Burkholderiales bacterium]